MYAPAGNRIKTILSKCRDGAHSAQYKKIPNLNQTAADSEQERARIFKLLRSPGSDFMESIPPAELEFLNNLWVLGTE